MPDGAEVALVDSHGQVFSGDQARGLQRACRQGWRGQAVERGASCGTARTRGQRERVYSAAPLGDDDVFVVLSARRRAWCPGRGSIRSRHPLPAAVPSALALLAVLYAVPSGWWCAGSPTCSGSRRSTPGAASPCGRSRPSGCRRRSANWPNAGRDGRRHRRPRRLPARQPRGEGRADARDPPPGEEQPAGHLACSTCSSGP
jgi:hypothetical protein